MIKRIFDILVSFLLLVFLMPLMIVAAIVIAIGLGSPIFFCQERPGLRGKVFRLFKFRTMRDAFGEDGCPLPDAERLTKLGRILRSTSIDEIPELWNVLKGDMSLVGPRPLLVEYLARYTPEQARRHLVRPGITGLAQISGRQLITFSKRIEYDVYYVDHWSFWLDIKIMLMTIPSVLKSHGYKSDQLITEVDDLKSE